MKVRNKREDMFPGDDLAKSVWESKYSTDDEQHYDQMHERIAKEIIEIDSKYHKSEEEFFENKKYSNLSVYGQERPYLNNEILINYLRDFKYIVPQGSIMHGAGIDKAISLSNCFVIDSAKDSYSGIFLTDQEQAQLMKRRGGVGHDISFLRPKGTVVNNSANSSTGAVSFAHRFSNTTREVAQEGRRGALMLSIDVNHIDIMDFIKLKRDNTSVTGANISIKLNDNFIKAAKDGGDYLLRYPCDMEVDINEGELDIEYEKLTEFKKGYVKKIKAKEYWDELIKSAKNHAEPGLMYWDNVVGYDPAGVYSKFKPISSNPCGEQFLQPYDSCRLLATNLFSMVKEPFTDKAHIDFDKLYEVSYEQQRIGDNIVDLEIKYIDRIIEKIESDPEPMEIKLTEINLWKKIQKTAKEGRRTGCGITALGDMLAALGLKYDSDDSLELIDKVMKTKMKAELDCTIDLSILRGSFQGWDSEKEFKKDGNVIVGKNRFYEFLLKEFPEITNRMMKFGRRNVSWSTIAPTGSVSILTQTTSGCEPIFMAFYMRRKKINPNEEGVRVDFVDESGDSWQEFPILHQKFKDWIDIQNTKNGVGSDEYYDIENKEDLQDAFENSPWYGSTANDINWLKRNEVQSILQRYTTNAISSCLVGDNHLVSSSKGLKYIEDMVDVSDKGFNETNQDYNTFNHKGEEVKVDEFYNNGLSETIKLTFKNGTVIQGTPNHKMRVLDEGYNHIWKELKDIEPNKDFIIGRKGLEIFGNSQKSISKIIGRSFKPTIKGGSTKEVKIPTRVTTKLARLIGYLNSDGCVGKNGISLCQLSNNVVEDFRTIVSDLFNLDSKIVKDNRCDGLVNVVVNSRILKEYMEYIGLKHKTCYKQTPKIILEGAGRKQTAEYLKGLTLDGYVSSDKICIMTTCSHKLAKEIVVILNQFGIEGNIVKSNDEGTERVFPNNKSYKTKGTWDVYCNKYNSKLFSQYIGFSEDRKTKEFSDKFSSIKTKWMGSNIPDLGFRKNLQGYRNKFNSFKVNKFIRDMSLNSRFGDSISYDNLLYLKDLGVNINNNILDKTYMFSEVVEKEIVDVPLETFDLHIKEGNSYTVNNLISHNTINLPSTVTEEIVSEIYMDGWKRGLKGQTVYVDGSRSGVLVSGNEKTNNKFEYKDAIKRPKEVPVEVHTTTTQGTKYNVIVGLVDDKPYEVFITEYFTSKDSLTLKKVKRGRYDLYDGEELYKEKVTSEMSESEEAITRMCSMSLRHGSDVKFIVEQLNKTPSENMFSFTKSLARVLKKYIPDGSKSTTSCNDCGSTNVIFEEGCNKCLDCGSSACG